MKVRIKERINNERWQVVFEGKCSAIFFREHDRTIAQPSWGRINLIDSYVEIIYHAPTNIRWELDKGNDLWARQATTPEELEQLIQKRTQQEKERTETLVKIESQKEV